MIKYEVRWELTDEEGTQDVLDEADGIKNYKDAVEALALKFGELHDQLAWIQIEIIRPSSVL